MAILTLNQIAASIDAAFANALAISQRVAPEQISDNAALRTDVYTGPRGSGFAVVATVNLTWRKLVIVKQHGPETERDRPMPTLESLVKECQQARAARYEAEASVYELADAETKLASADSVLQAEGAVQKAAVLARRLQIKSEIPKPQ